MDREEIVIVGTLPPVEGEFAEGDAGGAERAAAEAGRISRFRETTREERIEIARQAEHRYGRKVAWGARVGDTEQLFTVASVPVMTRLRQPERVVLDTLVDAGVARSRSDALAWAVRLVGQHADDWLAELRSAMAKVDDLRAKGPDGDREPLSAAAPARSRRGGRARRAPWPRGRTRGSRTCCGHGFGHFVA